MLSSTFNIITREIAQALPVLLTLNKLYLLTSQLPGYES